MQARTEIFHVRVLAHTWEKITCRNSSLALCLSVANEYVMPGRLVEVVNETQNRRVQAWDMLEMSEGRMTDGPDFTQIGSEDALEAPEKA